ncbi:hypothetical protein YC2023_061554 [Brassica napus]
MSSCLMRSVLGYGMLITTSLTSLGLEAAVSIYVSCISYEIFTQIPLAFAKKSTLNQFTNQKSFISVLPSLVLQVSMYGTTLGIRDPNSPVRPYSKI